MSNLHDIDAAELAAAADAIAIPGEPAAELPDEPAAELPATDQGGPPGSAWAPIAPGAVDLVALYLLPAWSLAAEEKAALADALAPVLDDLFPGGLGAGPWAPYLRLALVAAGIVAAHRDPATGKLPPLLRSAPEPSPARESAPA